MTTAAESPVGKGTDVSAAPAQPGRRAPLAGFAQGFVAYLSGEFPSLAATARAHGFPYAKFRRWTLRPEQRATARAIRRPLPKPSGALL